MHMIMVTHIWQLFERLPDHKVHFYCQELVEVADRRVKGDAERWVVLCNGELRVHNYPTSNFCIDHLSLKLSETFDLILSSRFGAICRCFYSDLVES